MNQTKTSQIVLNFEISFKNYNIKTDTALISNLFKEIRYLTTSTLLD